jgi:hypothetical protein
MTLAANRVAVADDLEISYDIFAHDSVMTVWVDLSPLLDEGATAQLKTGVDLMLHCRLRLFRPKRLLPDDDVITAGETFRVGYRPVTDDFRVYPSDSAESTDSRVLTLPSLISYFSDSVTIPLIQLDSLDPGRQIALEVVISSIELTDLNLLRRKGSEEDDGESPVQFLFRRFLDLTGYGSREYKTRSRSFFPDEVPEHP